MSPKVHRVGSPREGEHVSRNDIEAKLREIRGEVDSVGEETRSYALVVGVTLVVVVVGVAFLLGRRKARRKTTVVEIRRV
jgi:hypothetical protein